MELRESVDDNRYRTDFIYSDYAQTVINSSMAAEVSGFDFYQSSNNQLIDDYYSTLAVLDNPMDFSYTGFRGRCYVEILNSCNYFVREEKSNNCIRAPYSYSYVQTNGDYSLYKSDRGVSLVYYFDDVISTDNFLKTDPLTRETTLMHSMVVDKPEQTESSIISDAIPVPYEITDTDQVSIDGNTINVYEECGYIVLKPDDIRPGQISVYLTGLKSSDVDNWYFRNAVALVDINNESIVTDYSTKINSTYKYYYGNDDVIFSFESIDEKVDSIYLIFTHTGEYNLDSIQIYSRPYEQMEKTLDEFYEHAGMEDITYDYSGNHLNISAKSESDRYLYVAIPYSLGWHAKVDGKPVEIIRANFAFMAVPITSGNHNIEMTYSTPHLFEGLAVSAIGIVIYLGYFVLENAKRKKAVKCAGQNPQE
jgi:uncharacterized membrane protein YfhO